MNAMHYRNAQTRDAITAAYPVAAAAKGGVCFALIALLAVMVVDTSHDAASAPVAAVAGAGPVSPVAGDRPAAHRKQVFDERRARFDGAASARLASDPASRSSESRVLARDK